MPKCYGGLGMRDLNTLNTAYLFKLLWRLLNERNSLWSKLYCSKYLYNATFWIVNAKTHHSGFWKTLLRNRASFKQMLMWQVGLGTSISFWDDNWLFFFPT